MCLDNTISLKPLVGNSGTVKLIAVGVTPSHRLGNKVCITAKLNCYFNLINGWPPTAAIKYHENLEVAVT